VPTASSATTRAPQPAPVEGVASYARRVGDEIRVLLTLPDAMTDRVGQRLTHRRVWVRFSRKVDGVARRHRALAEVTMGDKPVVVATIPVADLGVGVWNLSLRIGREGPVVPLEARLLLTDTDRQPLALLVGPRPRTRLPEPAPR
jgi:hypothetical protein